MLIQKRLILELEEDLANIKIQNTAVDETWRFGTFRADVNPDGKR